MLVECVGNSVKSISCQDTRTAYDQNIHQDEVYLEIGRQYIVYGVVFRGKENIPWFLIVEEEDEFPTPHLAVFFKIIDGKIYNDWEFTWETKNLGNFGILPKIWIKDPFFMEKLIDAENDAWASFNQLKSNMRKLYLT